jgi:hypothetical protein
MENSFEPDQTNESTLDRDLANSPKDDIDGWAVDADPKNDPTYPMKHRNGADYQRLNYPKPLQQPPTVEILHSIERPGLTRVYGTSTPPNSLSGIIRRFAFKYSESTYAHWVPLVLADRLNAVEGFIDDLRQGIIPNIFAERGWKAEWKYNRKQLVQKVVVAVFISSALIVMLSRRRKKA